MPLEVEVPPIRSCSRYTHDRGGLMKSKWEAMTIDELFALREQMQELLTVKLVVEKTTLESRLQTLNQRSRILKR